MAVFKNDPFPGTDYSQYLSWKKITTPAGQVFYVVPGNEAYVYDPVASNASGRKVFRGNPQLSIEKAQEEEDLARKQAKQQAFMSSPLGQLIPVGGTVGGLIAANKLMAPAASPLEEAAAKVLLSKAGLAESAATGATGTTAANAATVATPEVISLNGAPPVTPGIGVAPYLGAAGAGLGAYGVYNAIQKNNSGAGALSGAGLGLGLGAAAPLVGLGPLGWGTLGLMAAGGALGGFGLTEAFGQKSTKEIQDDRWKNTGVSQDVRQQMYGHDYFAGTGGEQSRDESLLTPDAIRVNPDNYNNIKDWDSWDKSSQDEFLSRMLAEGKVREKKGGIYYDDDRAQELAAEIRAKKATAAQAAAQGALSYNGPTPTVPSGMNLRTGR